MYLRSSHFTFADTQILLLLTTESVAAWSSRAADVLSAADGEAACLIELELMNCPAHIEMSSCLGTRWKKSQSNPHIHILRLIPGVKTTIQFSPFEQISGFIYLHLYKNTYSAVFLELVFEEFDFLCYSQHSAFAFLHDSSFQFYLEAFQCTGHAFSLRWRERERERCVSFLSAARTEAEFAALCRAVDTWRAHFL